MAMKSKIIVPFVLFFLLCSISLVHADTPWLHTEGNRIKDPNDMTVVLRGISLIDLGFLEGWEDGAINMINRLTDMTDAQGNYTGWYPRIIRIPIAPPDTSSGWPYRFDPNNDDFYNDLLRPVVDYCASKDLYAIIDWHYIDDTTAHVSTTSEFWEYMAPRFAGDSHVFFELYNEPINNSGTETENWLEVRGNMQTWFDIVRTYAANNLVLVAGPNWSQAIGPAASYPLSGSNIVIVSHIYPGHWRNPSWYISHITTCASVYPIIMTEWGFSQSGSPDPNDLLNGTITEYGQPVMDFIEGLKISNTAWVASYDWGPPMFNTDWTLRIGEGEMGGFVKDTLYLRRDDDQPGSSGDAIAPAAPTGLTATAGLEEVSLDWDDNTEIDLDGYNVYRSTTSGSGFSRINIGLSNSSDYADSNIVGGTTYYYVVTAADTSSNESGYSGEDSATPFAAASGTGAILCEWWMGVSGTAVSDLTSDVNYPDNPSERVLLTSMDGPAYWLDNYGTRMRGYLNPVVTGSYTFWIASDDSSELWLSTNADAANASRIAYTNSWTNRYEWTKYASQQSSPRTLTAGQKYYIEVLHKEGGGGDHVAAAWEGPGISQQVIDGIYLSPCCLEFKDFADFGFNWARSDCNSSNSWCGGSDFNRDGSVTLDDLRDFVEGWLAGM